MPALAPRSWSLAARLRAALAVLTVALVASGVAVVLVLREADRALSDQTRRAFPARVAASQLLTALVDQETGLRGYALTRDRRFLEPYRQGLIHEQTERARLDQYVLPSDRARLALLTVDAAVTAWRDQYASLRTTEADAGGTDDTIEFGRELFERVRVTSAELDRQLTAQVRSAQARADDDRRLVLLVLSAMACVLLLSVVLLQRALRRSVLRPLTTLAQQVSVVSTGAHAAAIVPSGPPDIERMGEGVESMRLELVGALAELEEQRRGLERRSAELARSNADLEQFAYVASHDLQEPLRKVASFCRLIEQRYSGQLDERGEQYIAFAVDGAKRMQQLISDLLMFSRVGRTSAGFAPVDLRSALAKAWATLDERAAAAQAELDVELEEASRVVHGDASLLQLLLTNLLGNALKYRAPGVPARILVSSLGEGEWVRVLVADNGIGIPAEYADKVFVIFQRLHGRDEYEGTGIGLALAKKVVEFHGGTISVVDSPLGGACLSFTLPRSAPNAS